MEWTGLQWLLFEQSKVVGAERMRGTPWHLTNAGQVGTIHSKVERILSNGLSKCADSARTAGYMSKHYRVIEWRNSLRYSNHVLGLQFIPGNKTHHFIITTIILTTFRFFCFRARRFQSQNLFSSKLYTRQWPAFFAVDGSMCFDDLIPAFDLVSIQYTLMSCTLCLHLGWERRPWSLAH